MAVVEGWEKSKIGMLKGERVRPVWVLSWGSPVRAILWLKAEKRRCHVGTMAVVEG